jgi:hypothetical protein
MAKKKAKKCVRKTKEGRKCKGAAVKGRKTCMAHGPKRKKKKKAKKKAKKKVVRKKKKVTRKKAKKKVVRKKSGVKRTQARCRKLLTTGRRCKCYCEPGGVYCLSHRKKERGVSAAKIRKNPNPASINCPW